ncbi:MAG: radical SAM protein, partial [Caldiserica bacterium]
MRILLVNPPVYDFACFDSFLKPLGLLYISQILKSKGFKVYLLDYMDRFFKYENVNAKDK